MFEFGVIVLVGITACTLAALTFPIIEHWPIWDALLGDIGPDDE